MSDNAKSQRTLPSASSEPSAERRRLLRAAAVSAPFIATLPTNLAAQVANGSTSQCIVAATKESGEQGLEFDASDSADKWVRVEAFYVTIEKAEQAEQGGKEEKEEKEEKQIREFYYVDSDPFNGNETFCYVGDRWDVSDEADAMSLGDEISVDYISSLQNEGWEEKTSARRNVKVLAMFKEGEEGGFIKGLEYQGLYPNKQRPMNAGAIDSCLCSVDPNYRDSPMCG